MKLLLDTLRFGQYLLFKLEKICFLFGDLEKINK